MADIKCIDVSTWQGDIDWKKVKASGINYAILRAGFGRSASQIDNKFEQNYKNASSAGVVLGAYWYSYAVDEADAVKEAEACLAVLKGKKLSMPVFFDMEESSMSKLGKKTLTAMAKAFCNRIIKGGFKAGVYSNPNWFTNYLDYNALKKLYPIWLAQYYKEAQLGCDIWQYTSEGKVSGVAGNVDMNIIYNKDIVSSSAQAKPEADVSKKNFEVVAVQTLLMIANRLGLITQTVPTFNNVKDKPTGTAIKQMKKYLGMQETEVTDSVFITKTYSAILDAMPITGDINKDGKVNIEDVTALQKDLAGIEE
ncbi:MAG: GH25 family lysozyme [Ruminococcus sp.]